MTLSGRVCRATCALLFAGFAGLTALPAMAEPESVERPGLGAHELANVEGPGHDNAAAHGGGHGEPHISGKDLAFQLANFAVLLFIIVKFGGGAINKALAARHQQLKTDLASASDAKSAAEARLAKQQQRLDNMEREIATMRETIQREAEEEKVRLIAAAEERAKRVSDETAFIVQQQMKEAELSLRREIAESAVRIAEELIRRSIQPQDQTRFVNAFVSEISAPPSAATTPRTNV